ncbi:uncharacterized protein LOC134523514 [Chroicocephalus ridibundus]|uniref:uncharacterized protein LOC134523514 n=1 Tax=Chroicocephalus ridibundus TaxID=1192867 RepID=UPI002FDE2221
METRPQAVLPEPVGNAYKPNQPRASFLHGNRLRSLWAQSPTDAALCGERGLRYHQRTAPHPEVGPCPEPPAPRGDSNPWGHPDFQLVTPNMCEQDGVGCRGCRPGDQDSGDAQEGTTGRRPRQDPRQPRAEGRRTLTSLRCHHCPLRPPCRALPPAGTGRPPREHSPCHGRTLQRGKLFSSCVTGTSSLGLLSALLPQPASIPRLSRRGNHSRDMVYEGETHGLLCGPLGTSPKGDTSRLWSEESVLIRRFLITSDPALNPPKTSPKSLQVAAWERCPPAGVTGQPGTGDSPGPSGAAGRDTRGRQRCVVMEEAPCAPLSCSSARWS